MVGTRIGDEYPTAALQTPLWRAERSEHPLRPADDLWNQLRGFGMISTTPGCLVELLARLENKKQNSIINFSIISF